MHLLNNIRYKQSETRFSEGLAKDDAARKFFSSAGIRSVIRTDAPLIRVIRILSDCYLLVIIVLATYALFDEALATTAQIWKVIDAAIFVVASTAALYLLGIYDLGEKMQPLETLYRTAKSFSLSIFLSFAAYFILGQDGMQARPLIVMGFLAWVTVSVWHGVSQKILSCFAEPHSVLIVGGRDDESKELSHGIAAGASPAHKLAGHITLNTSETANDAGAMASIEHEVARLMPDIIAVSESFKSGDDLSRLLSERLQDTAPEVVPLSYLYETIFGMVSMDQAVFLPAFQRYRGALYRIAKRMLDLSVSLVGILFLLFILAPVGLAVKATSPGPVLFIQRRIGKKGKVFRLLKFRTMQAGQKDSAVSWPDADGERVTPVGRFLRKTRLDEVPQFINVLKGDLALVGPRPERPELEKLIGEEFPLFKLRHLAKPGLTGWAQVMGGYPSCLNEMREKLQYDLFYIKNRCFFLDLVILLKTSKVIFQLKGK